MAVVACPSPRSTRTIAASRRACHTEAQAKQEEMEGERRENRSHPPPSTPSSPWPRRPSRSGSIALAEVACARHSSHLPEGDKKGVSKGAKPDRVRRAAATQFKGAVLLPDLKKGRSWSPSDTFQVRRRLRNSQRISPSESLQAHGHCST